MAARALIEDGTERAVLFRDGSDPIFRSLDGTWVPKLSLEETIMPDDLREFRAASDMEVSALLQDASAS